jgi:two-component system nitrogen regulation response regulator GlnG
MTKPALLLVDDDPIIRESLGYLLRPHFLVYTAESRNEALDVLSDLAESPSLALIDLGLPPYPHEPTEGFALVPELLARNADMRILVLSGQSEKNNVKHAMSLGAADFIPKPCEPNLLRSRLDHQVMLYEATRSEPAQVVGESLEGQSPAMQGLSAQISQFAVAQFPVLIEGESGTGKELIAGQLHRQSSRAAEPYIPVNCAAFASELLASQLFGHAKGSFTGATREHSGFFEEAGGGTLFLDEIGEMSLELQSNLLRVIEYGEYYRVGESRPRRATARIIAATNKDLLAEARNGNFREDLYYRLSVLCIKTPPLRERGDDKLLLLAHFQRVYQGSVPPFQLSDAARETWLSYDFPGNVRELRNVMIRLGTKYPGQTVEPPMLLEEFEQQTFSPTSGSGGIAMGEISVEDEIRDGTFSLDDHVQQIEWRYIQAALNLSDGNLSRAAKLLNVNRTTLYSKIQRLEERMA